MSSVNSSDTHASFFLELEQEQEEEGNPTLSTFLDTALQPEEIAEHDDETIRLYAAIESLPLKFRNVVWLRYKEELTFDEIGRKLHIPPTTAQTYFYRARVKLRLALAS